MPPVAMKKQRIRMKRKGSKEELMTADGTVFLFQLSITSMRSTMKRLTRPRRTGSSLRCGECVTMLILM